MMLPIWCFYVTVMTIGAWFGPDVNNFEDWLMSIAAWNTNRGGVCRKALMEVMMLLGGYLVYGVAAMFLTLSAICALGAIIYPFYMIFDGIRNKLL